MRPTERAGRAGAAEALRASAGAPEGSPDMNASGSRMMGRSGKAEPGAASASTMALSCECVSCWKLAIAPLAPSTLPSCAAQRGARGGPPRGAGCGGPAAARRARAPC